MIAILLNKCLTELLRPYFTIGAFPLFQECLNISCVDGYCFSLYFSDSTVDGCCFSLYLSTCLVHMSFSTIDGCCFFLYCPVYCRSILSNATKIAPPSICLIHDIPLFSLSRETNGHLSKDLSNMETPNFTHLVIFCHEKFYFSHPFASYLSNFGPNVRGLATKFWRPEHISNFLHTLYLFIIDYVCNNKRLILCE